MLNIKNITTAVALASASLAAQAAPIVLNFEGIGNNTSVGNFYAAQGVTFSPSTLALVDSDAGGSGNFANEPSANTIMFFTNANNAILNFGAGFTTGFSFFYTSSSAAIVKVYDGINGMGTLLASLNLSAQFSSNCAGDPSGGYCNWTPVGVNFAGLAKSIDFGGAAGATGFDDITFGSSNPGGEVPEPATLALLGVALAGIAVSRRRRQG